MGLYIRGFIILFMGMGLAAATRTDLVYRGEVITSPYQKREKIRLLGVEYANRFVSTCILFSQARALSDKVLMHMRYDKKLRALQHYKYIDAIVDNVRGEERVRWGTGASLVWDGKRFQAVMKMLKSPIPKRLFKALPRKKTPSLSKKDCAGAHPGTPAFAWCTKNLWCDVNLEDATKEAVRVCGAGDNQLRQEVHTLSVARRAYNKLGDKCAVSVLHHSRGPLQNVCSALCAQKLPYYKNKNARVAISNCREMCQKLPLGKMMILAKDAQERKLLMALDFLNNGLTHTPVEDLNDMMSALSSMHSSLYDGIQKTLYSLEAHLLALQEIAHYFAQLRTAYKLSPAKESKIFMMGIEQAIELWKLPPMQAMQVRAALHAAVPELFSATFR